MRKLLRNRRGIIMVFTLLIMPICVMMGAIMLQTLVSERFFLHQEKNIGQSFFLAETGLNIGYSAYVRAQIDDSLSVESYTHIKDSTHGFNDAGDAVSGGSLEIAPEILAEIPFERLDSGPYEGWYEYNWEPGSPHESLTGTGLKELIRFRVSRIHAGVAPTASIPLPRPTTWEIVSEAEFAGVKKVHRQSGKLEGFFDNALMADKDLNEFIRGADQFITGKVHANGNIFMRLEPGRTLSVRTDAMTATGKFVYGVDAVGRPSSGFTVKVSDTNEGGTLRTWPSGFQSDSANWNHPSTGAMALFNGTVKDGSMGAKQKSMPPVESFEPDGYYADAAAAGGLLISVDGSGNPLINGEPLSTSEFGPSGRRIIREVTIRNHLENRNVRMIEIDFIQPGSMQRNADGSALEATPTSSGLPITNRINASDYGNGLIYSAFPIVLSNAKELPRKTTIVSQSSIITRGDFNKEFADQADFTAATLTKKSSALITKDRIFHVSKGFQLSTSVAKNATPNDREEYPGDNNNANRDNSKNNHMVIEVNAALVDGAPLHDEVENRKLNPDYPDPDDPNVPATIPKYHYSVASTQATSWDDFLESLGSDRVVKKRGSIIHMDNATLLNNLTTTNPPLGVLAWHRSWSSHYSPPVRDYGYDPTLKTDPPPFQPVSATKMHWQTR